MPVLNIISGCHIIRYIFMVKWMIQNKQGSIPIKTLPLPGFHHRVFDQDIVINAC
jgi:hypothetical protein